MEAVTVRKCETCGTDISHRHPRARYCSLRCTEAAAIKRGTKTKGRKKREASPDKANQKGTEI